MWKNFCSLFRKDCQMMLAGKFFLVTFGSLMIYTLFINFGYVNFMNAELYNVYLFDPQGTQQGISELIAPVTSLEELNTVLSEDVNGVGIDASSGTPDIVFYFGSEKADHHRADYALSLLRQDKQYTARIVGTNTPELKKRKEMSCELLFIEIIAVGFLGIASVLFKEKQMGVIRVHAILPVSRIQFILSKLTLILSSDLLFAAVLTVVNLGMPEGLKALPGVLLQAGILSLVMALVGFLCAELLPDFKQFSLIYLVIAVFITTPVFLSVQAGVEMEWMRFHPMYHLFTAMKNAYFQVLSAGDLYYGACAAAIILLFLAAGWGLGREMKKEG